MTTLIITLAVGAIVGAGALFLLSRRGPFPWREVLAALPLPTLALAASYGVWSFNMLYLPMWAAVASAASFELVYIGLAVAELRGQQIRRARYISVSAVAVSVVYNTLSGLFHRNPEWLANLSDKGEWGLAVLHGAPLAIVAYAVSDLLLHRTETVDTQQAPAPAYGVSDGLTVALARQGSYPQPVQVEGPEKGATAEASEGSSIAIEGIRDAPITDRVCPNCATPLTAGQYGAAKRWGYCKACKE